MITLPKEFFWKTDEDLDLITIDIGFLVSIDKKSGAIVRLGSKEVKGPFMVQRDGRWMIPEDFTLKNFAWDTLKNELTLEYSEELTLSLFFDQNKITGRLKGKAEAYRFPCLWNLKVDNDELVTTNNYGEIIPNPIHTMKLPVKVASCTWHNYHVGRPVEGVPGCAQDGNKSTYRLGYSGGASMPWLFYGNKEEGFYVASYDERFPTTILHTEATDHLLIAIEKVGGDNFDSNEVELSYLTKDWHEAANRYRNWALNWYKAGPVPEWVFEENGLLVHYDFKFQSGEIRHRFTDIPKLYEMAKEAGFKHLYVSAWNEGGFDTLYPQFFPDLELGTIRDLKKAISDVKADGGKISFYINTRIFNHRSEFYQTLGKKWAAKTIDGNEYIERYGKETFSTMCAKEDEWTKVLKDFILWLVDDMGATGMYVDQIGVYPRLCYDKNHTHERPDQWALGYQKLLSDIVSESEEDPFYIMEGCGDIYSQYVGAQLVHAGWGLYTPYGHPEIYKYAFPEIIHVDMVHPKPVAIDVEAIGLKPHEVAAKSFLLGTHYWVYDHVLEDSELWLFMKRLFALRDQIKLQLRRMRFIDNDGVSVDWAKRYTSYDEEMILFYNSNGASEIELTIPVPNKVEAIYFGDDPKPETIEVTNGKLPTNSHILGVFRWKKL